MLAMHAFKHGGAVLQPTLFNCIVQFFHIEYVAVEGAKAY